MSERKKLAETATNTSSHTRLDMAKQWLQTNYTIKVNLLDRSKVLISPSTECGISYEHPVTEDDILLHAFSDEVPIPRGLLKMLLASPNQMQSFNPVHDYLEALQGKYKGPSQIIDLLCSSLHLPEGQSDRVNVERAGRLLRKWIVATAACALGIRQNDVALGLVGDKAGIGKTTFFESLVPQCLKEYYQVAQKDDRVFPMHISFAQRFILNFDEFAAITANNEQDFKLLMSTKEIDIKRPSSRYIETVPRVASCCFTSNKNRMMGGFIRKPDAGLLRRLAVIEVDAIDDYRKELDVDQLWAEAVTLLGGGFDPVWSQKEYQQFVEENRQYVIQSLALQLIHENYRLPRDGKEGVFMTPMDILVELRRNKKVTASMQKVNDVTIGQALILLGYKREMKRTQKYLTPRYGYYVVPDFGREE